MSENQSPSSHLYGRRKGRPLRVRKSRLVAELLPELLVTLPNDGRLDLHDLFGGGVQQVWLEIGFGGGEHLAAQAALHPQNGFIGCEPFINGVASLLDHVDNGGIGNVRIYNDDARHLLDALPEASLDKCFVLFADPWPKKRHAERRFIGPQNLARLARAMKPGALLRLASDHPVLIEWMREVLAAQNDFTCAYTGERPPGDWVQTRYQEKAAAVGRQAVFMDYVRVIRT